MNKYRILKQPNRNYASCCFAARNSLYNGNVSHAYQSRRWAHWRSVGESHFARHWLDTNKSLILIHSSLRLLKKMNKFFLKKGDVCIAKKPKSATSKVIQMGWKIFHRFHFSSALKRMSVIAGHTKPGSMDTTYIATCKGAPEVVKSMVINKYKIRF